MKWRVFAGAMVVSMTAMAATASAHVKWFVECNIADNPLPIRAVFTTTFFLFMALFLTVFYVACEAERTTLGVTLSRMLNRWTESLHRRSDDLLRAVAAVSFVLLWADGGVILTPELKASHTWISAIQLLIPLYLFGRATLPAAGVGIIALYGYGAASYGVYHMLDYPVFIGLGVFFALSVSKNAKLVAFRFLFLRWTVALSLLWPSMEKFVYPGWVAPIAITHPELTLGFDVSTVITAAGVVEFGLAFALFWTPLIRRLAALVLILLLTAATFDFGKVDGIGHSLIITILLVTFADPGGKPEYCRPLFAPLVSGVAILAAICLYTGAHAFYYASKGAALAPLMSGILLLAFIVVCVFAPVWLRRIARGSTVLIVARVGGRRSESRRRASNENSPGGGQASRWRTPLTPFVPARDRYGAFVSALLSSQPTRDRLPKRPKRIVGIRRQAARSPTAVFSRTPTGWLR